MMPLTDTDAHGSKALGSSNAKGSMPSLLRQHYLGLHKMRLGNIMCTEMVRTLSQPGLARVAQSIREVGWLDQFAPSIVIPREAVRDGEQLTAESALKATGRVLDGNHRVTVLKREFAEDDAFLMRIYRDFANPALERVIANSFNEATESMVERTLYDKLFFQNELQRAIMRQTNKKKEASPKELREMYQQVGVTPPSPSTLRYWQTGVNNLHQESFQVLKEICEDSSPKVDSNAVTLLYLTRKEFAGYSPVKQALCLHLLTRYKTTFKKAPTSKEYESIAKHAGISEMLIKSTRQIVPEERWTPELKREINKLAFETHINCETWVRPHFEARKEEVDELLKKVSTGGRETDPIRQLKASISSIVAVKPMTRVRRVLEMDATLSAHLTTWDEKYQAVVNHVNLIHIHGGVDGRGGYESENDAEADGEDAEESGDGGILDNLSAAEEENDDVGWNRGLCCPTCKPSRAAEYCCPKCSIRHMSECPNVKHSGDGRNKARRCRECPEPQVRGEEGGGSGSSSKGRKRARTELLRPSPSSDGEAAVMEMCMGENTALHNGCPLDPTTTVSQRESILLRDAPKLAIVSIGAEPRLLKNEAAANTHMRVIVKELQSQLHPQGTMAFFVPHPWSVHSGRLYEALTATQLGLVVEEEMLVLTYKTRGGGRRAAGTENHLRYTADAIMLAHNGGTELGFTCNKRVTVDDIYGHGSDPSPPALAVMSDLDYPGAGIDIPPRAVNYLVNRYTNPGDTVLSLSAEKHSAVEVALGRGRRVEVFVSNVAAKEGVKERIKESFRQAYKNGMFKVSASLGKKSVVGPSRLPDGVAASDVLGRIQQAFDLTIRPEEGRALEGDGAVHDLARIMAKDLGYDLRPLERESSESAGMALFPIDGKNYDAGENDLPAWGDFVVFNSRSDAFRSLSLDERRKRYVRLLHVANNQQLKGMLSPGKEECKPGAELYLRVAATCPLFYTRWAEQADDAHMELKTDVPQHGSRADLLRPFDNDGSRERERFVTPVTAKVFKNLAARDYKKSPFLVRPGLMVVRSCGFEVRDSSEPDSLPSPSKKRKLPVEARGITKPTRKMRRGAGDSASEEEVDDNDEDVELLQQPRTAEEECGKRVVDEECGDASSVKVEFDRSGAASRV